MRRTSLQIVVWVALSRSQRRDYAAYLGGESVLDVLSGKISSPLAAIQALKKVLRSYLDGPGKIGCWLGPWFMFCRVAFLGRDYPRLCRPWVGEGFVL